MKHFLPAAVLLACLGAGASADDTLLVPNSHGGYNVIQAGGRRGSVPFFGVHGFAAHASAHAGDKPVFILHAVVQDDGHGNKHTVYQKIRFATPEQAEAAKLKLQ